LAIFQSSRGDLYYSQFGIDNNRLLAEKPQCENLP
jgi:hypothetical protein